MNRRDRRAARKQQGHGNKCSCGNPGCKGGGGFNEWVDSQTAAGKPAIAQVFDNQTGIGHVYVVNAPALGAPVLASLGLPNDTLQEVGAHLGFLLQRHITGHPVLDGHRTGHELDDGAHLIFDVREPTEDERDALMCDELVRAAVRYPDAPVLLVQPRFCEEYGTDPHENRVLQ